MSNVLIYGHHRDSNQLVSLQSSATGLLQVESKDQQMSDKLDEIKTAIETKTLSKLTDSVDISNQQVLVGNFPTDYTKESTLAALKVDVEDLRFDVLDLSGKINNNSTYTNAIETVVENFPSNFSLESGGNLASIKTNTDKLNNDSIHTGAIQVEVKNTSVPVTGNVTVNTISGFALESGGNLASIKTNTDKLNNDSIHTSALQVEVKNTSVPVTGNVTVNTISGFALESGGNLASIKTNTDKLNNDSIHTSALQVEVKNTSVPVTGNVTVNTISGYALESGNLTSIKTNTDKLNNDSIHTSALQVEVKNTSVPVSGNVTVNTISGYALETTQVTANSKLDTIGTKITQLNDKIILDGSYLQTNVKNFPSSTNSHIQAYDPTLAGYFDVTSTGIGVNTSALDVAVKNTVGVTGSVTISNLPATQPISGSISNNFTLDTTTQATNTKLDGIKSDLDNLTFDGTSGNLNVNVASGSITVSSVNIKDSSGNNLNSTSNALNSYITNTSIPVTGSFYPGIQPVSGSVSITGTPAVTIAANQTVNSKLYDYQNNGLTSTNMTISKYALDCASALYTSDSSTRYALTSTSDGGSKRALDTNIINSSLNANITNSSLNTNITNSSLVSNIKDSTGNSITSSYGALNTNVVNSSTSNLFSVLGLNTYQILPKMKSFAMCGLNGVPTAPTGCILAGSGTGITVSSYKWGKTNNRKFYVYTPGAAIRTIYYTYIDSSGNEQVSTTTSGGANTYTALASGANIVGVNEFSLYDPSGNQSAISTDAIYITVDNTTSNINYVASMNGIHTYTCGVFTCPNNAIAMITNIHGTLSTNADYYYMNIWDAYGNRTTVASYYMYQTGVNNFLSAGGGEYACLGRILQAGESVCFSTGSTSATNKIVTFNVRVVYL